MSRREHAIDARTRAWILGSVWYLVSVNSAAAQLQADRMAMECMRMHSEQFYLVVSGQVSSLVVLVLSLFPPLVHVEK